MVYRALRSCKDRFYMLRVNTRTAPTFPDRVVGVQAFAVAVLPWENYRFRGLNKAVVHAEVVNHTCIEVVTVLLQRHLYLVWY